MTVNIHDIVGARELEKALAWLKKWRARQVYPEYYHARTIDEAIFLLHEFGAGASIIAGGIDLLGLMKNRVIAPEALVNIKTIPGLSGITETSSDLNIGALTIIDDVEKSPSIREKYPILAEAAHAIGSPQIRNMGTVAGNLCQDVRCWYYRRSPATGISYSCRRKSAGGICYARDGENQYHAIFGAESCLAVCPSDLATVLLALDARIDTVDSTGGRSIPLDKFYTNPGNVLAHGEIIKTVKIPRIDTPAKQRFIKFRVRKAIDFAIVSVAVLMTLDNSVVSDARVVLGGVAAAPCRAVKAENILKGATITQHLAEKAAAASVEEARPLSQNGYKIPILQALVKRAISGV